MAGAKRERSPRTWELRVYLGRDPVTKRKRWATKTVHGGVREADDALAAFVTEVKSRKRPATEGTLAFLLDRWLETSERMGRSPATLRVYRSYIDKWVRDDLGDIELRHLSSHHLDSLYTRMARQKKKPATIRQVHSILRAALHQAVRWHWLVENPADFASVSPLGHREVNPPTVDEVRTLVEAANSKDPRMAAMVFVAATTGARRGELCALRWRDLDLSGELPTLTISHSVVDVPGAVVVKDTKTHQARRLALDTGTVEVLNRVAAMQAGNARAAGVTVSPDAFVFSQAVDGSAPYRPERVTGFFRRLRKDLNLGHVTFHHLRHFMATQTISAGHDVRTVAGRLGHSGGGAVTMRVYAHFVEAADRGAANHMGSLLATPLAIEQTTSSDA